MLQVIDVYIFKIIMYNNEQVMKWKEKENSSSYYLFDYIPCNRLPYVYIKTYILTKTKYYPAPDSKPTYWIVFDYELYNEHGPTWSGFLSTHGSYKY